MIDNKKKAWNFRIGKSDFSSDRKWAVAYGETIRIFIDNDMVRHFDLNDEVETIRVAKNDYSVILTKSGFFIRKKRQKSLIEALKDLKEKLNAGLAYLDLKEYLKENGLFQEMSSNRSGSFLFVSYPKFYANSHSEAVKLFLGNSILSGIDNENLSDFINNNAQLIVAKAFNAEPYGRKYYRLYLRKRKNV